MNLIHESRKGFLQNKLRRVNKTDSRVSDTHKRGEAGGLAVLLFLFFGPIRALYWLAARPPHKLVELNLDDYPNAEEALAAAASLDQNGEWDTAVALYQSVAQRWPEHALYVANCIKSINEMQTTS